MAVSELAEVQALLERVLPDPSGFAQRLLLQLMAQFGDSAAPGAGAAANAFYTATATPPEDVSPGGIVLTPEPPDDSYQQPDGEPGPGDTNTLLAAALGACECWGLRAYCDVCWGQGSAGWTEPIPELFDEFIAPALAKLPSAPADSPARPGTVRPDHRDNHGTEQGEH